MGLKEADAAKPWKPGYRRRSTLYEVKKILAILQYNALVMWWLHVCGLFFSWIFVSGTLHSCINA